MSKILLLSLLLIASACGKEGKVKFNSSIDPMPGTGESLPVGQHLKIFTSLTLLDGSLGKELSYLDAVCMSDAMKLGLSGEFKAMVSTKERHACTSADCIKSGPAENTNWVLSPETEYRLPDEETLVGVTNEAGLFVFPLQNALSSTPKKIWTGFAEFWTSPYYSFESCGGLSNPLETGFVGEASALSADFLKRSTLSSCKEKHAFICVEQIRN